MTYTNKNNTIRPSYTKFSSQPTRHYLSTPPTEVNNTFSLGTAIKTGFGMNIGNKLGDWLFGPPKVETNVIQTTKSYDCSKFTELLEKCIQTSNDCNTFLESLKQCQKNN